VDPGGSNELRVIEGEGMEMGTFGQVAMAEWLARPTAV